ncbi:MAG: hypothetical protein ACREKN_04690 [Longimicrobiaceae bacterium]
MRRMIQPNVRASFGRLEAEFLLSLAGEGGESRLREEGVDALLDDERVFRRLLRRGELETAPPRLVFYLLVRHSLLSRQLRDRRLADYTAALLIEFGKQGRAHQPGDGEEREFHYLADILLELERARGEREFLLRVHLGNFALWLAGVFPDHITHRVRRRGAPPLSYYDELGAAGFRGAARTGLAAQYGLGDLFVQAADEFSNLRSALNSLSDALFFPRPKDPVERVLREVGERFQRPR